MISSLFVEHARQPYWESSPHPLLGRWRADLRVYRSLTQDRVWLGTWARNRRTSRTKREVAGPVQACGDHCHAHGVAQRVVEDRAEFDDGVFVGLCADRVHD